MVGTKFEARSDGELVGLVTFRTKGEHMALTHTEVPQEYSGQGIAGGLVRHVLTHARDEGWSVLPYCPFISAYISTHDEFVELVPENRRAEFGL